MKDIANWTRDIVYADNFTRTWTDGSTVTYYRTTPHFNGLIQLPDYFWTYIILIIVISTMALYLIYHKP